MGEMRDLNARWTFSFGIGIASTEVEEELPTGPGHRALDMDNLQ